VKEDPKILGKSTSATEVASKLDKAANTNNSIVSAAIEHVTTILFSVKEALTNTPPRRSCWW
jgi:hypothetical protein